MDTGPFLTLRYLVFIAMTVYPNQPNKPLGKKKNKVCFWVIRNKKPNKEQQTAPSSLGP